MHVYAEYGKSQSVFIPLETSEAKETNSKFTEDNKLLQNGASTSKTMDYMALESKFDDKYHQELDFLNHPLDLTPISCMR